MLHEVSDYCAVLVLKKSRNGLEKRDVLTYGFELMFSHLLGSLAILFLGAMLGGGWKAALFLASFISLRLFCGGYHAESYGGCFVSSIAIFLGVFWASEKLLPIGGMGGIVILQTIATAIILLEVPVVNKNHPLSETRIALNKRRAIIILAIEVLAVLCLCMLNHKEAAYIMSLSDLAVAILMIISKMERRKYHHDKSLESSI